MMTLEKRIQTFIKLGEWFSNLSSGFHDKNSLYHAEAVEIADNAIHSNGWFTSSNILLTWKSLSQMLEESKLRYFLSNYDIPEDKDYKSVAIIMAGNIPAVGFHDLFCVLIGGHNAIIKMSSDDKIMMNSIFNFIISYDEAWGERIRIIDGKLEDFDAVIATGSNNTSRYFEYYFGKYPNIIRKNRNGIAVLDGTETKEEIEGLAKDIFTYFGLGCRNISKIFVPKDYSFDFFYQSIEQFKAIIDHHKYLNNYEYHKSIYLINRDPFLDNGFLMLMENTAIASPLSVLHYEYYQEKSTLSNLLQREDDEIQCIIGENIPNLKTFEFGAAQFPEIHDFADGIDTLQFVLQLT